MSKTAQISYERYRVKMAASGYSMPPWEDRNETYREAWNATAEGVLDTLKPVIDAAEDLHIAAVEFVNDWKKGDFALPRLAALDAEVLLEKCERYRAIKSE